MRVLQTGDGANLYDEPLGAPITAENSGRRTLMATLGSCLR